MGIIDKAREAKSTAAEKAIALKEQATSAAADLKDQAAAGASRALDASLEHVSERIADLNAILPIVRSAGYALTDVSVEIGLTPKLVASFHVTEALTDEETDKVVDAHQDSKLAVMLIRALHRAATLQRGISIGGLKPMATDRAIGLSPVVVIRFG